jgi:hypothetical protein
MNKIKIPCEECISLAMCVHSQEIRCTTLLKFLNKVSTNSVYPEWPNLLEDMRTTLRGNWCTVGINNDIYKVEKDRIGRSAYRLGMYDD